MQDDHENSLRAGCARWDITPSEPIGMGGYGQRAGKLSQGVHDPLYAKALYLENNDSRFLIVTNDLVCIPNHIAYTASDSLSKTTGLDISQICICASHTHSGPDISEFLVPTEPLEKYKAELLDSIIQVGKAAVEDASPCMAKPAVGEVGFLVNRRTLGRPNRVDPRVFALQVNDLTMGKPKAVLFGCGCHAVTLGHENLLISADYPGVAQTILEARLGVENALFFNMAEGNVIPETRPLYDSLDTRGYSGGSFTDAETIGMLLADAVEQALADAGFTSTLSIYTACSEYAMTPNKYELAPEEAMALLAQHQDVISSFIGDQFTHFTPQNLEPLSTLWRDASLEVVKSDMSEGEMRHLMSAVCNYFVLLEKLFNPKQQQPIRTTIQLVQLGQFCFLALPGEVLVENSLDWQKRNLDGEKTAFIIGLANGFMGYLPHPDNFTEPGCEYKYETLMNALEPAAMGLALDEGEKLSKSVNK